MIPLPPKLGEKNYVEPLKIYFYGLLWFSPWVTGKGV